MKIGLYFGTFNPIHIGHLIIANHMAEFSNLDQIWMRASHPARAGEPRLPLRGAQRVGECPTATGHINQPATLAARPVRAEPSGDAWRATLPARRRENVPRPRPRDLPAVVVHQQVVMPAEEKPVGNVGAPAVALPMLDVVRFGLARV